jgi:hypothetical protein
MELFDFNDDKTMYNKKVLDVAIVICKQVEENKKTTYFMVMKSL